MVKALSMHSWLYYHFHVGSLICASTACSFLCWLHVRCSLSCLICCHPLLLLLPQKHRAAKLEAQVIAEELTAGELSAEGLRGNVASDRCANPLLVA